MARGRRRLRLAYPVCSLLLLAASLHAPTAYSAVGDPPAGSPAGAVYELPLERGRADGAPQPGAGSGAGGAGALGGGSGGAGGATSLYRSENNFGSSSRVPGIAAAGAAGVAAAGAGAGGAGDSSLGVAGESGGEDGGSAGALARGEIADAGNTSTAAAAVLIGAIAALAAAIGYFSRRVNG